MTQQQLAAILGLRGTGYAVVLFTPEELRGANPDHVEYRAIELTTEVIDCLCVPNYISPDPV